MGGDITGPIPGLTTTTTTGVTSGYCWVDYPYNPTQTVYYPYQQYPQTFCSGDVHVFPCPHCDKCKCGKATVKRDKRKDGR